MINHLVKINELRRLRSDPNIILIGLAIDGSEQTDRYIDMPKYRFNSIFDPRKDVYLLSDFVNRHDDDADGVCACV